MTVQFLLDNWGYYLEPLLQSQKLRKGSECDLRCLSLGPPHLLTQHPLQQADRSYRQKLETLREQVCPDRRASSFRLSCCPGLAGTVEPCAWPLLSQQLGGSQQVAIFCCSPGLCAPHPPPGLGFELLPHSAWRQRQPSLEEPEERDTQDPVWLSSAWRITGLLATDG